MLFCNIEIGNFGCGLLVSHNLKSYFVPSSNEFSHISSSLGIQEIERSQF